MLIESLQFDGVVSDYKSSEIINIGPGFLQVQAFPVSADSQNQATVNASIQLETKEERNL